SPTGICRTNNPIGTKVRPIQFAPAPGQVSTSLPLGPPSTEKAPGIRPGPSPCNPRQVVIRARHREPIWLAQDAYARPITVALERCGIEHEPRGATVCATSGVFSFAISNVWAE